MIWSDHSKAIILKKCQFWIKLWHFRLGFAQRLRPLGYFFDSFSWTNCQNLAQSERSRVRILVPATKRSSVYWKNRIDSYLIIICCDNLVRWNIMALSGLDFTCTFSKSFRAQSPRSCTLEIKGPGQVLNNILGISIQTRFINVKPFREEKF